MRSLTLPLAFFLVACGGDEAPAVVDTTDVVIETPASPDLAPDTLAVADEVLLEPVADEPVAEAPVVEAIPEVAPPPADVPAEAPVAAPTFDAREGALGQVLRGGWTIVTGPAETVTFGDDGSYSLFAGDRPMGSGEWNAEEGILYLGDDAYVIDDRRERGLTFSGGPADTLILERIDG